ncbi:hypothetical protein D0T84_21610 [Dysgonomonas sp. 521]|uniref:hypothetical protein n=1 Tax=Dysgonomonas sp. 521 TaxID=2302932 RepID=UPI0013D7461B|nr:hypothetical protein [Dysgonomonas sp. 521]NDV97468.1 hypothetical protein [Dysgonomonas sp. 521]
MKNKNSVISFVCFSLTGIAAFMLFAGLFTASWDYVIEHWEDTAFVLGLGTFVPISFFTGLYFLIKSIRIKETLFLLPTIVGILVFLFCLVYYFMVLPNIIELYQIKLGIK